MIKKMIREEFRKNSRLYRGRSFLVFPLVVFLFSLSWNYLVVELSTISFEMIGNSLVALAGLMGIAVGLSGFSGRDAFQNVLGDTNYLVFSSHTLPVSRKKLYAEFFLKDVFFYMFLVLIPLAAGFMIPTGFAIFPSLLDGLVLFFFGLLASSLLSLSSLSLPSLKLVDYSRLEFLEPVADKSVVDVFRSSGGFLKILFSLGVLTFFYWIMVLKFPLAAIFLENPLLSFSVMLGLLNLSIYNWLNRFDSTDGYSYLPLDRFQIAHSKEVSYLFLAVPLSVLIVLLSYLVYPGNLGLSILAAVSTTIYGMAVAVRVLGLEPNERLFHADVFLKYMLGMGALTVPLLYLSIIYSPRFIFHFLAVCGMGLTGGSFVMLRTEREELR
ncbi:MAG: hypothetical protein ABEK10_02885 [Candidatus Nanosalina sp.]